MPGTWSQIGRFCPGVPSCDRSPSGISESHESELPNVEQHRPQDEHVVLNAEYLNFSEEAVVASMAPLDSVLLSGGDDGDPGENLVFYHATDFATVSHVIKTPLY
eukprot:368217-Rhodomonas_salina.5